MEPIILDHVAFWVADRQAIAATLTSELAVHEIDRQDNFTLLGADARRFKMTLFDAEGPREAGSFVHTLLSRQGLQVASPDEIAFHAGWIDADALRAPATSMSKNPYGQYLLALADE